MHVFPATANDCLLQTNSFGLVNRHIFRPIDRNADSLITERQKINFYVTGGNFDLNYQ